MNQKLSCEIVHDLLPSYVDGLTCEATNTAVRAHLASCPKCKQALADMQEPKCEDVIAEIDYLKAVRRRAKQKITLAVLGAVATVALLLCIWIFAIGFPAPTNSLNYKIEVDGTDVKLTVTSMNTNRRNTFSTIRERDGVLDVTAWYAPTRLRGTDLFCKPYQAKGTIEEIRINGQVVWEDQVTISNLASLLFDAKAPYVGDMAANQRVADALGISGLFGPYTNELHTSAQPYGWDLNLQRSFTVEEAEQVRKWMERYSCAMLATIGNLGYVTWNYSVDGTEQSCTVTAEDATAHVGKDIKQCAETLSGLTQLLEALEIPPSVEFSSIAPPES